MQLMTLIPAFKVQYLPPLLACLERQTVRADAVLLSDDSPGADFLNALEQGPLAGQAHRLKLQAVRGPCRGAYANVAHLRGLWDGRSSLVHWLLDDDIVYPDFYEKHLAAHARGHFLASVSLRWNADQGGQPIERLRIPPALLAQPQRVLTLAADVAFATTVAEGVNWMGEFSNAVLRAELVPFVTQPQLAGVPLIGLEDLATFLAASVKGPLLVLNEHLGFFRTSAQQNSAQLQGSVMKLSTCAWMPLAIAGERLGLLSRDQVMRCAAVMGRMAIARYHADPALAPLCAALARFMAQGGATETADAFVQAWTDYARAAVPHAVPAAGQSAAAPAAVS
jgi:hypothetical protein